MEEDGGAAAHNHAAFAFVRVVADKHLDAVRVVRLAHLLLELPLGTGGVIQTHVAVVVSLVSGVGYPQIIGSYFNVGHAAVVFYRGFVGHPQAADGKNTGGGAAIALFL